MECGAVDPNENHSGLIPANVTTLAHFSVSVATKLPKSEGEPAITVPPRSANRALSLGIGEGGVDLVVELVDDLGRRAGGSANAVPAARLVARHELVHRRHVRQSF